MPDAEIVGGAVDFSNKWSACAARRWLGLCLVVFGVFAVRAGAGELAMGPWLEIERENDQSSWRGLGPLFELAWSGEEAGERMAAVPRPLFTRFRTLVGGETEGWDALWPLAASRRRRDGHYTYVLNFIHTGKPDHFSVRRERWWWWPLFFVGRDNHGQAYAAVFPLGGRIADLGFSEDVRFVLFPLYIRARTGELVSRSWLWPIFNYANSPRIEKWRVFPLYGVHRREGSVQRFFLWPLLHMARAERQSLRAHGFFLFPFYGDLRQYDLSGEQRMRSRTVLWPFFKHEVGPLHRKLHAPWPFYQNEVYEAPEEVGEKWFLWPFYGRRTRPESEYRFWLWPLLHRRVATGPSREVHMHWAAPFWRQVRERDRESGREERLSQHLWPLFSRRRSPDSEEVGLLDLWPGPHPPVLERNYAPLWRLYRYRADAEGVSHNLLWGLWRYRADEETTSHGLFPLYRYRRSESEGGEISLLAGLLKLANPSDGGSRIRVLGIFPR